MRNYIILNGQHSKEIEGLLISTLPPISKPKMRTEIQEIDGRDGDIVTNLGYSAYEKSFDIGLTYNYEVDDVIKYFSGSGTVTFSNEPDKFYNYQIIDQIDYERLLRFKKATVKMHVQPFKYSAAENERTYSTEVNLMTLPAYSKTTNGITLTVSNGVISVAGIGSAATEFYVPINALTLAAGNYTLSAAASGTKASAASIRLIKSVPSNADSFGSNYLALLNNDTATLEGAITDSTTFYYLWFYITAGTAMNFTLNVSLSNVVPSITVRNSGNISAKPILDIIGNGMINLTLNNNQVFTIDMQSTSEIIIKTEEMNAYYIDGTYANRIVTGDYDDFNLTPGANVITWTGDISEMTISNYSRWL